MIQYYAKPAYIYVVWEICILRKVVFQKLRVNFGLHLYPKLNNNYQTTLEIFYREIKFSLTSLKKTYFCDFSFSGIVTASRCFDINLIFFSSFAFTFEQNYFMIN